MTYSQLKERGVKLSTKGDADHDGVMNKNDCRPLNKRKQDDVEVTYQNPDGSTIVQNFDNTQEALKHAENNPDLEAQKLTSFDNGKLKEVPKHKIRNFLVKESKAFGSFVKKEAPIVARAVKEDAIKIGKFAKKEFGVATKKIEEAQKRSREKKLGELNSALKNKVKNEEDIDIRTLSDGELHKLAVLEGEGFFGDNKYESELKRRIKTEYRLRTDLAIEKEKDQINESKRLKDEDYKLKHPEEGGFF